MFSILVAEIYSLLFQTFLHLAHDVMIGDIMSACTTSSELPELYVKQASEQDIINVLSNTSTRRKIFPDNMCVVNFEPFDAVLGNASMMLALITGLLLDLVMKEIMTRYQ